MALELTAQGRGGSDYASLMVEVGSADAARQLNSMLGTLKAFL